ncbi:3-coathanger stack domain-containing protein [Tenacibaculum sp. M341]|uniref:3-coathanger stack domain-containing protein n=1 Tax=Tenacibaculum sp. M341 TaxID=2530339 RepID=UPI001049B0DF|nr:3-coathanger stack domain-containing protein [Tenacibaculum sp. M341]TCI84786.1 T9SS type A sorting domain-containing protein [Tenacibaculum sp. M341]
MNVLEKKLLILVFFTASLFSYAQFIFPNSTVTSVRKGTTFSKVVSIQGGNAEYIWQISGGNGFELDINRVSGRLLPNQTTSIIVSDFNNYNTSFTKDYTLNFIFTDVKTNNVFFRSFYISVYYFVGCEDNLTIITDVSSGTTDNKSTRVSIIAKNTIDNGGNAKYDAGERIRLIPGFKVERGGKLKGFIEGCSTSSNREILVSEAKLPVEETIQMKEISKVNNEAILPYPNPFNNQIKINTEKEIVSWSIYNLSNRKIKTGNEKEINTSDILKGIYTLHIALKSGEVVKKKIIKN